MRTKTAKRPSYPQRRQDSDEQFSYLCKKCPSIKTTTTIPTPSCGSRLHEYMSQKFKTSQRDQQDTEYKPHSGLVPCSPCRITHILIDLALLRVIAFPVVISLGMMPGAIESTRIFVSVNVIASIPVR